MSTFINYDYLIEGPAGAIAKANLVFAKHAAASKDYCDTGFFLPTITDTTTEAVFSFYTTSYELTENIQEEIRVLTGKEPRLRVLLADNTDDGDLSTYLNEINAGKVSNLGSWRCCVGIANARLLSDLETRREPKDVAAAVKVLLELDLPSRDDDDDGYDDDWDQAANLAFACELVRVLHKAVIGPATFSEARLSRKTIASFGDRVEAIRRLTRPRASALKDFAALLACCEAAALSGTVRPSRKVAKAAVRI
jgi:hypothetical protein